MTKVKFKFLLIFKTLKAKFKGVQIKAKAGTGRPLGQDGLFTKIWLSSINALGRRRQGRMQRLSTESETKIEIYNPFHHLRSMMADQNTKIIFIWVNFGSRGFTKSPTTNPRR